MSKLIFDAPGTKFYETGVSKGVLFVMDNGAYKKGVAWNGLTSVSESPSGADATDLWADNIKYGTLRSAETFGGTIEAYTYPDEWNECDGLVMPAPGVYLAQQSRKPFGFSYVTNIGSDETAGADAGYKIHLVYGATASPSERSNSTINDSPEAMTLSWEFNTNPPTVDGYKPVAHLIIDSRTATAEKLAALEDILYGTTVEGGTGTDSRLPLPAEVITLMSAAVSVG